jgi:hypothetical protein
LVGFGAFGGGGNGGTGSVPIATSGGLTPSIVAVSANIRQSELAVATTSNASRNISTRFFISALLETRKLAGSFRTSLPESLMYYSLSVNNYMCTSIATHSAKRPRHVKLFLIRAGTDPKSRRQSVSSNQVFVIRSEVRSAAKELGKPCAGGFSSPPLEELGGCFHHPDLFGYRRGDPLIEGDAIFCGKALRSLLDR